jgi:hypothetical protein
MKRTGAILAATLFVLSAGCGGVKTQTFSGEITDRDCVEMAGHTMMLKNGETPRDCTITCVKLGGKYVLYVADTKMVYQLDDQTKPEKFAGGNAKVTGTYDAAAKTIHVTSMVPGK